MVFLHCDYRMANQPVFSLREAAKLCNPNNDFIPAGASEKHLQGSAMCLMTKGCSMFHQVIQWLILPKSTS